MQPFPPPYGNPPPTGGQPPFPPYGTPPRAGWGPSPSFGTPVGPPPYGLAPQGQPGWGPSPWSPPTQPGPRRPVKGLGWLGVGFALLGAIGSRITWAEITGFARQGVYVVDPVVDGREIGVGTFCLLLCIAIGILSGVLAWRTVLGCAIALLVLGCLLMLVGGLNVVAVNRIAGPGIEQYGLSARIGAGLWMTFAAGVAATAIGIAATVRANSRVAVPSRWDAPTLDPYNPQT